MKRWILLIFLVVGLSGAVTLLMQYVQVEVTDEEPILISGKGANPSTPSGKAVLFEPVKFNFGTMPQRATGKHTWKIKNEGPGDLEIWMKSSTCSCTLAKFKDGKGTIVKPGETSDIDLEFETRENNGNYEKGADIGTSDPSMPSFALRVQGQVFPPVLTYPADPIVNFGTINNDTENNYFYMAVFSRDRPDTQITKVTSSKPDLIVGTAEPMKPDEATQLKVAKGQKLTINAKAGLPLGLFREEVIVSTDHPQQPEIKLMVGGRMSGPIATVPTRLSLHDADTEKGGSAELVISVRNNQATKFEVVKAPKALKIDISLTDEGKPGRYKLVATIPPGTPAQQVDEDIVLKTDHPHAGEVIIPASVWVLNASAGGT